MPHSAGGWALRTVPLINTKKGCDQGDSNLIDHILFNSRLAERVAAPRAGCLEGNIFLTARVCIINFSGGHPPVLYYFDIEISKCSPYQ